MQQGTTFRWEVHPNPALAFDALARPLRVLRYANPASVKDETTTYHDDRVRWVMGQVAAVFDHTAARTVQRTDFDARALPAARYAFDLRTERYQYYDDGNLYAVFNAGDRATWLGDWVRGQPGYATHADNAHERQSIGNLGRPLWRTNAAGTTHHYGYDAMGRLNRIDYPGGDPVAYHPTTVSFEQMGSAQYGLAPGHWRQLIATDKKRVHRHFDGFWRERLRITFDSDRPATTTSFVETRYDHEGRVAFVSYPQRSFDLVDQVRPGKRTEYDPLGRVKLEVQDSELGPLSTVTEYLPLVFQKRVTNPRGFSTFFGYQVFDEPSENSIVDLWAPEGVHVHIRRDGFGKALSITRGGPGPAGTVSATRWYVYDWHQRLCKTIEPETGATVQDYDASSNVAWRASGLGLPDSQQCNRDAVPPERKIAFGYDLRERLTSTTFGDGSQHISRSYTPDSLLSQTVTSGAGRTTITWNYRYYNRRHLRSEEYNWGDPQYSWWFSRDTNAYGDLAALHDRWGRIGYAPNALGQPTEVSGYASGITYHPNGAVAGYTLANGQNHSTTQNTRGLPELWQHGSVSRDRYRYDAHGNVTAINDEVQGLHRSMPGYDGLDRLREAHGPWGSSRFDYDALDNLVFSQVGARSLTHRYGASNRLERLEGSLNLGLAYDANGNVIERGGLRSSFDIGNRLLAAHGRATYAYDGHGRRNLIWYADGSYAHQAYTQDGKLRFGWRLGQGSTRHVYLGDKLIAEVRDGGVTTYPHTDALGSPVARTNASGAVISRTRYEPYGATVAGSDSPGWIGFTGHVSDADTGLVYMQQRYYDPIAGRFLSVDPVVTDWDSGSSFNRYVYGQNNPYRYTDPDGRQAALATCVTGVGCAVGVAVTVVVAAKAISDTNKAIQNSSDSSGSSSDSGKKGEAAAPPATAAGAPGSNVRNNNSKGKQAENEVAADLEAAGREVDRQVRKDTPFGPRVIDIEVKDKDGNVKGGVEVKQGNSRYRQDQRAKDRWLRENGYPVDVVRKP